ncbi:MAG: hypothetical protein HPY74_16200 [Firmicutes bacterium]|nr:hypothetical protein [Bacillota bacterium]
MKKLIVLTIALLPIAIIVGLYIYSYNATFERMDKLNLKIPKELIVRENRVYVNESAKRITIEDNHLIEKLYNQMSNYNNIRKFRERPVNYFSSLINVSARFENDNEEITKYSNNLEIGHLYGFSISTDGTVMFQLVEPDDNYYYIQTKISQQLVDELFSIIREGQTKN